ncbi:galactokinase [Anaerotignum lactatifermentans]|uniref:galactokinase n=1 Tax=Anaerotignum lactatifermentans TaxID=160404 RepID=UPI002671445E|nr:galactokinase family protein [Anaerotignum lactatifermentans]
MKQNWNKESLLAAYPRFEAQPDFYLGRMADAEKGFADTFDKEAERFFSAPGRTEIGGNHTDHQHGCVLAAAVDLDIFGAAAKNDSRIIRIFSEGYGMEEISLDDLEVKKEEINTTASLIRGVASKITQMGYALGGLDMYTVSNVLKGSGISSSAAYEVLVGTVINALYCENKLTPVEIAQIGQYAENVYFGKMSGLMDQTASSVGGVVAIDFRDNANPVVRKLDFDFTKAGYALCIIDSGADHADLSDEYSAIPMEMRQVAAHFGKEVLREVALADFLTDMAAVREKAGDRATLRAYHFLKDNQRAIDEAAALEAGDFDKFLSLVKESGHSSFMYLQNVYVSGSVQHQEVAYALAACEAALAGKGAYRVHGGGFAGTIQAFVPQEMLAGFVEQMENAVGKGRCHVLSIRPAGGTELMKV